MAADLGKMLSEDFSNRLDRKLYAGYSIAIPDPAQEEQYDYSRKSTYELDWEENSHGFDDLFSTGDFVDIKTCNDAGASQQQQSENEMTEADYEEMDELLSYIKSGKIDEYNAKYNLPSVTVEKPVQSAVQEQPEPDVRQEPLMSLYDLFGFSEQERSQVNTKKRGKHIPSASSYRRPDLFSQTPKPDTTVKSSGRQALPPDDTFSRHRKSIREKHPHTLILFREG